MKKRFSIVALFIITISFAQVTANRFFYELTFKPKKDSAKLEKVMTILDVVPEKSLYRDYTIVAQDSIIKAGVEAMQKSGVFKDLSKMITMPKFSYKVFKATPTKEITYAESISSGFTPLTIGYNENINFDWKILSDKEKIGEYNTQKATVDFGGRQWTAWFSSDIPLRDGPYKFFGLPGLIVKIEDADKNYSWELKGNKKVDNWEEQSYAEKIQQRGANKITIVSEEKFDKTLAEYKKDPFASARPMMSKEMLSQKMPGSDQTIGDLVKQQEKMMKDFYEANDNPIEIPTSKK